MIASTPASATARAWSTVWTCWTKRTLASWTRSTRASGSPRAIDTARGRASSVAAKDSSLRSGATWFTTKGLSVSRGTAWISRDLVRRLEDGGEAPDRPGFSHRRDQLRPRRRRDGGLDEWSLYPQQTHNSVRSTAHTFSGRAAHAPPKRAPPATGASRAGDRDAEVGVARASRQQPRDPPADALAYPATVPARSIGAGSSACARGSFRSPQRARLAKSISRPK